MAAADLILHGGKVYTAEPGQGLQQAVAMLILAKVDAAKVASFQIDKGALQ
ncbi:hypothetical protein SAMN05216189_101963 [Pseudomonas delhiensis]|uniref:Uncharacterized protein n=1 Tax=Pseudomonas delhiensis TaxID=366289 RepID=A0A239I5T2_9PSED|nr:hypothetical protein [Pseudomonas delhiensis]SDJ58854.1 hypothetical protein SAMN05216189_101963 [Pseudomonas delhiensis]SNS88722.1 hypothetical protein SAMN06295949_10956 [Pseudomonas delhiensis]